MKRILFSVTALLISSAAFSQFWTTQNSGFTTASRGIAGMEVPNANTVWAFAYDGMDSENHIQEFTKTSNGGTTWTAGSINLGNPALSIANISGIDANTAWVAAFDPVDGQGGVWKTTNGGTTWVNQHSLTTTDSWTNYVHFFDANNGVMGGDPTGGSFEVYTTSNGGTTWTRVPAANIPAPLAGEYGYNNGYYAVGDNMFFYTGKGRIFKSTDKGLTWTVLLTNTILTDFGGETINGDMAWSDANRGMILRKAFSTTGNPTGIQLHRTTDGGANWTPVTFTGITAANRISDISYIPGTNILVASSTSGGTWKSGNNGTTWTALDTGVQHLGIRCSDASNCYSGGFNTSSTVGGMFKSSQAVLAVSEIKAAAKSSLSIYPNPTKGEINIKTDKKIKTISVLDASGRTVNTADSDRTDISNLPKGVYHVKAELNDGTSVTEKVIKQ